VRAVLSVHYEAVYPLARTFTSIKAEGMKGVFAGLIPLPLFVYLEGHDQCYLMSFCLMSVNIRFWAGDNAFMKIATIKLKALKH